MKVISTIQSWFPVKPFPAGSASARIAAFVDSQKANTTNGSFFGGRRKMRRRLVEFANWLNTPPTKSPLRLAYDDFTYANSGGEPNSPEAQRYIEDKLRSGQHLSVHVEHQNGPFFDVLAKLPNDLDLLEVKLSGPSNPSIEIFNKRIQAVQIGDRRPICFHDCFIRRLRITGTTRITLRNSFIERISFSDKLFEDLHIEGGALFGIDGGSEATGRHKPFVGRVTIKNLYLPRKKEEGDLSKEESPRAKLMYEFRNIRMHLSKKGDILAAGVFHGAELALERKDEKFPTNLLNFCYERISDYGNSTSRPLWILLCIYAITAGISYFFGSVTITGCALPPDPTNVLSGWQRDLCDSPLSVALLYPLYSLLNPLNAFVSKPIMVASNIGWAALHGLLTILALICLFLFVLAIRRRFKLEKPD